MPSRAFMPVICTVLLLAGCQPKPSKEYLEALKDFDAVTVKMVDKEFEIQEAIDSGNTVKAEVETERLNDIFESSRIVTERIVNLRPSIPDARLYAEAMKEQEQLKSRLESLRIMRKMKTNALEKIKADVLEAERKFYDAVERSAVHQPRG